MDLIATSVDRLIEAFNKQGIVYCHWKSNLSLAKALAGSPYGSAPGGFLGSGETDLDLLVDRKCLSQAIAILRSLDYKPAVAKWGPDTPSISHYYGFDSQLGQLIHIHLFSRVLTGESFVKSHLFPFESLLLENTYCIDQLKVTSKPAELVLFILRTFIKYGSPLDLIHLLGKAESIKEELHWLLALHPDGSEGLALHPDGSEGLASQPLQEALCLLKTHCPVIDEPLFIKCINTLDANSSTLTRLKLARQMRRSLHSYARYTNINRAAAYLQFLWGQAQRRLGGSKKNKMLQAGGAVIAIVGPDATGKSTLVSECGRWLGDTFAVRIVHAGKPPSSLLTAPVDMAVRLARGLLPQLRTGYLERHTPSKNENRKAGRLEGRNDMSLATKPKNRRLVSLIYAMRCVTLAWRRRQLLVKARRQAANGDIVICDRYPSQTVGVMDSRRLVEDPTSPGITGAVYNRLAHLEERLYKQIPPPDIALRLKVSIETAKKRNRERIKDAKGSDDHIEFRHSGNQDWYMSGAKHIYDIDTEGPRNETICRVKRIIWELL